MSPSYLPLAFVLLLPSCPRPAEVHEPTRDHVRKAPGLYGRLNAEEGARLVIRRCGTRDPIFTVDVDGSPLSVPLPTGVYFATVERETGPEWRSFEVRDAPLVVSGDLATLWEGEAPAVFALTSAQHRWLAATAEFGSDTPKPMPEQTRRRFESLRTEAHAEAAAFTDPRARAAGALAVDDVFARKDAPPPAGSVLASLPDPTEPALAALRQFAAPVWLAMKAGDDATRRRGQAWLDAVARDNPEPGARVMALYFALEAARLAGDAELVRKRYARVDAIDIDATTMVDFIRKKFAPDRRAQPGATSPSFSFVRLDDPTVMIDNDALRGELVLLDLWATWCSGCVARMPELHDVYETLIESAGSNGARPKVRIVSINLDEDPELARRFREERWPMPWTNLHIGNEDPAAVLDTFGLIGLDRLLLDENGTIIATGHQLHAALKDTLEEAVRSAAGSTVTPRE